MHLFAGYIDPQFPRAIIIPRTAFADTPGGVSLQICLTISSCGLGYIWLQNTHRFGCNRNQLFCLVFSGIFSYLSPKTFYHIIRHSSTARFLLPSSPPGTGGQRSTACDFLQYILYIVCKMGRCPRGAEICKAPKNTPKIPDPCPGRGRFCML